MTSTFSAAICVSFACVAALSFKSQNITNYKTVKVCFFSHSASDGPLGNREASQYSLSSQTGDDNDKGQITLEGWSKIEFNFHPENSILAFYGCRTYSFISKLVKNVSAKYIAGHGGSSGDSKKYDIFKGKVFGSTNENLYYVSDNGEFNERDEKLLAPIAIVTKKGNDVLEVVQYEVYTNVFVDDNGNIIGKGKEGEQIIKKENIKLWSQKFQKFVN